MTTPSIGTMNATFTDPTGVEWPLSDIGEDRGYFTTSQVAGWGALAFEYTTDPIPRGGESVRNIRAQAARITWPLHIYGTTYLEFTDRYRALRRAFLSTVHRQTPGVLKVARPDGTARQINVFYEDGFAGEAGENWRYANPVLTLYAPDGYWSDVTPTTVLRSYSPGVNFLSPFPSVSSSQVIGNTTITNNGDVEAWPTWTVTGPMTALTATNNTTGRSFILTTTLLSGEQATITTFQPTVRGNSGQNLVGSLNWPTAYLWELIPGDNSVTFTVGGSGTGTKIQLDYYARYDGV